MEHEYGQQESPIAIIPMKPLADSKTRLSRKFNPEQRADLSLGMLRRVIMAVRAASIDVFWVVGGDQRVRNLTRDCSGMWLEDIGRNLNDTMAKAFDQVFERGKRRLVRSR